MTEDTGGLGAERSPWKFINMFLNRERDALLSSVTHIDLALATVVIVSVLLGVYSFLSPLLGISQMDKDEMRGKEGAFVFVLGFTIAIVLAVVLYCLAIIRRRLIRSLEEELLAKANAIRVTSERFGLQIPKATDDLLTSIEKL